MTTNYWTWWEGGLALATVAISFPLLTGNPLGLSGALARLLRWGPEGRDEMSGDSVSRECGTSCVGGAAPASVSSGTQGACGSLPSATGSTRSDDIDRVANLVFLLAVLVGGGLAGWVGGQTWKNARLAPEFHRLFGNGLSTVLVLFGGGLLVGFGTRLSGGCTSGHGLSGCGRLQPASLIATAVFFGVAIAVSFLLEGVLT
jgi:uncharacterized membrane protein YedE/YeeE